MKKILLIICSLFITIFAGEKCDTYKEIYSALALFSGDKESLYPMGTLCYLEGIDEQINFKEFTWEEVRKKAAAQGKEFPTARGGQLLYDMLQASEIVVKEIVDSKGKISLSYGQDQVIGCYMTEEMLNAIGSYFWNQFRFSFVESLNFDPFEECFIFVFLDKKKCLAWGSHEVTKEDFEKNRKSKPFYEK